MNDFAQESKKMIKLVFDLVNKIDSNILIGIDKDKEHQAKTTDQLKLLQVFADISFKLYILKHTKNENDLKKISDFCDTLWPFEHLYSPDHHFTVNIAVFMLKMAYPLVGDDAIFTKFHNLVMELQVSGSADLGELFAYAMYIGNFYVKGLIVAQRFFQMLVAHEGRSIKNRDYWKYIKPVFEACEKEIEPNFTPREIGQLFNRHFYTKKGGELEQILKDHGEWAAPEVDGDYTEAPEQVATKMRKKYYKNFTDWLARRKQYNCELETRIIDVLEKTCWNNIPDEQIFTSGISSLSQKIDYDEALKELQEFAKGLKVD